MTDKQYIMNLKHGESYIVPESDYGRAEIWFINNVYILFEIPMYGGEPLYNSTYRINEIDNMIKVYESWN